MELHGRPQTFPKACTFQSTDPGAWGILLPGEKFVWRELVSCGSSPWDLYFFRWDAPVGRCSISENHQMMEQKNGWSLRLLWTMRVLTGNWVLLVAEVYSGLCAVNREGSMSSGDVLPDSSLERKSYRMLRRTWKNGMTTTYASCQLVFWKYSMKCCATRDHLPNCT